MGDRELGDGIGDGDGAECADEGLAYVVALDRRGMLESSGEPARKGQVPRMRRQL